MMQKNGMKNVKVFKKSDGSLICSVCFGNFDNLTEAYKHIPGCLLNQKVKITMDENGWWICDFCPNLNMK